MNIRYASKNVLTWINLRNEDHKLIKWKKAFHGLSRTCDKARPAQRMNESGEGGVRFAAHGCQSWRTAEGKRNWLIGRENHRRASSTIRQSTYKTKKKKHFPKKAKKREEKEKDKHISFISFVIWLLGHGGTNHWAKPALKSHQTTSNLTFGTSFYPLYEHFIPCSVFERTWWHSPPNSFFIFDFQLTFGGAIWRRRTDRKKNLRSWPRWPRSW